MPTPTAERLQRIRAFPDLLRYLEDELDWPLEDYRFEDLTFEYEPAELGLKDEDAAKVNTIHQLRPLHHQQPWGIFFVEFGKKRLPIVVLRRILRHLVFKKRASASAIERPAWQARDLLFISATGEEANRELTFAHFVVHEDTGLAELRVLGWDTDDTPLHMDYVARTLRDKLRWHDAYERDPEAWRTAWSDAFLLRHRHSIRTSQELAAALAELARNLRARIREILRAEDASGEIRRVQRAFQTGLIHDLDDEGFADMFAQTVTYGLFSLACRRTVPGEGTAFAKDDLSHYFTSPFLKEMLGIFLGIKTRRGTIDFDELGVSDVTDLLTSKDTHMEVVLADFNNRTRGEDPVIHFYEHFLTAYNKQLKVQRGVFYTPQPVVSYIVRSVHELLQTEFGLEDGLADTTTWGEMLLRQPGLKLPNLSDDPSRPRFLSEDEPFVQILDPATGTATFLVEVIEVIHQTMRRKWRNQDHSDKEIDSVLWQNYVPRHLLPRLHAYELMMAPYAIAHMKVGLKLAETGYQFAAEERARIYLTNALEPKVTQLPQIGFDALAHEAAAVNEVKWNKRFTVVIGNPPYAVNSANKDSPIDPHLKIYKEQLTGEKNLKPLNDDYVKFLRYAQMRAEEAGVGVIGVITNHSFASARLFRTMRKALLQGFQQLYFIDLRGEASRDPSMQTDRNVFDIQQGVGISLFARKRELQTSSHEVNGLDLVGSREEKYNWLDSKAIASTPWIKVSPRPSMYGFGDVSVDLETEYEKFLPINHLFSIGNVGYQTHRDGFVIDLKRSELAQRITNFRAAQCDEAIIAREFGVASNRDWSASFACESLKKESNIDGLIRETLYRPFDIRYISYASYLIDYDRRDLMRHMAVKNIGLLISKVFDEHEFTSVFVTNFIVESKVADRTRGSYLFPLQVISSAGELQFGSETTPGLVSNLRAEHVAAVAKILGCRIGKAGSESPPYAPSDLDIFHYAYAVFHSPGYRARYAGFLKIDFPRLPLIGSLALFGELARLGGELTALHLLESTKLAHPITNFIGVWNPTVEKVSWSANTVWLDKARIVGFVGVPEAVWNFHIGGYQVCEKWLKDRKGRLLSPDDIAHYQKIVVALAETIRLMAEIDTVIDQHGGWPGAFQTAATTAV